jgi:hypothetical protein
MAIEVGLQLALLSLNNLVGISKENDGTLTRGYLTVRVPRGSPTLALAQKGGYVLQCRVETRLFLLSLSKII